MISEDKSFNPGQTGRVIYFEMVGQNKFLAVIYWENGADDNNSSLTFHDKQSFTKDFEVSD